MPANGSFPDLAQVEIVLRAFLPARQIGGTDVIEQVVGLLGDDLANAAEGHDLQPSAVRPRVATVWSVEPDKGLKRLCRDDPPPSHIRASPSPGRR